MNYKKPTAAQVCSTPAQGQPTVDDVMNVWQIFTTKEMPSSMSASTPVLTYTSKSKDIINFVSKHPGQNEYCRLLVPLSCLLTGGFVLLSY